MSALPVLSIMFLPPPFSEFAGWAGLIMAVIAVFPRMMSTVTRGKVGRFESILKAQDSLLDDCRSECDRLNKELVEVKRDLTQERIERVREREHFYTQVTRLNNRVYECEGILRRQGWHDPRKVSREGGGAA